MYLNTNQNIYECKIMIVDDVIENVKALKRILRKAGYLNVVHTTDSTEVIKTCKEENPDIILLDLLMPIKSGFEILDELSLFYEDEYVPVIVITGRNDTNSKIDALQRGAKDYLEKPFDSVELLIRMKNNLEPRILNKFNMSNNSVLDEMIKQQTSDLVELKAELASKLLKAIEYRDDDINKHTLNVSEMSYMLGKALELDEKFCQTLKSASMMHDIGKVAVPDFILLSEGLHSGEEQKIMELHTIKGAEILSGSKFELIQMAEKIALTHHEKWDGSGYPNKIVGEEIPLEGRIVAICDSFDYFLSRGMYKEEMPLDKAIDRIKNDRGIYFDPKITDVFIELIPTIVKELYKM